MTLQGVCGCGGTPPEFNRECERCQFVELIYQFKELRATQKQFFKTRAPQWLTKAKELEKEIDKRIAELENPQPSLFDEL